MPPTMLTSVITAILVTCTKAWTETVRFNVCYGTVYDANDDKSYKMIWNGDYRPATCRVTFHGWDDDQVLNQYKICIRATTWNVQDNEVKLKYYSDKNVLTDNLQMTYYKFSSSDPTIEWCSGPEEYVDVELFTAQGVANQGRIVLEITAEMTFNYGKVVGWSVGGAILGIAIISVIVTVIIVIKCRRRRGQQGQVIRNPNTTGTTVVSNQSMSGGYTNSGFAPPGYFPSTNNSYGMPEGAPYQTGQRLPGVHQQPMKSGHDFQ